VLEEEGHKTKTEINETGGECLFLRLDVTSEAEWQQAVAATLARFSKLDVLVNNAGIGGTGKVEDTTVEEWDRVMEVNVKGVFLGTKAAIPELRRSGGGSIINISSQVGLVGTETASPQYQASKGAVRMLTKATAIQYAGDHIRVNSVHPGPISTPMLAPSLDKEMDQLLLSRIPLKKFGEPDNVAFGVLLLASDESCFMTGSEIVIDGGYTAW
jgi:NAD(P)-dependent dehydrogenase (short-subunit alcohol dehydrogenase family)